MHKIILFLGLFSSVPTGTTHNWIGATNGTWSTPSNWSPASVPNSTTETVIFADVVGGAKTLQLDQDATVNKLTFNSTSQWTISSSTAKKITFGGTSPTLTASSQIGTLNAGIILNNDLNVVTSGLATLNINTSIVTSNGYNFRQSTPTSATFNYLSVNGANAGIVGGTYYLDSGTILLASSTSLGTINGIELGNAGASPAWFGNNGAGFSRPIAFVDTGSKPFMLTGTGTNAATVTGSISHDLYIEANVTGNWSGFSTSANIISAANSGTLTINTTTFPTNKIQTLALKAHPGITQQSTSTINAAVNLSNDIDMWCLQGTATTANLTATAPVTLSGNIVLNSNSSTTTGNILNFNSTATNKLTYSGVISNSAATPSRVTVKTGSTGPTIFTGSNTYTSPTTVGTGSELTINGSITSNVTLESAGVISGRGTIGGTVTASTSNAIIAAYSRPVSPAVTDVLTTTGNVTMGASAKLHVFTSATASSKLAVTGNVTFTAGASVVIGAGSTALTSGNSAVIMTYTGTSSGTLTPPAGYTISDVAGVVTLTKT